MGACLAEKASICGSMAILLSPVPSPEAVLGCLTPYRCAARLLGSASGMRTTRRDEFRGASAFGMVGRDPRYVLSAFGEKIRLMTDS